MNLTIILTSNNLNSFITRYYYFSRRNNKMSGRKITVQTSALRSVKTLRKPVKKQFDLINSRVFETKCVDCGLLLLNLMMVLTLRQCVP